MKYHARDDVFVPVGIREGARKIFVSASGIPYVINESGHVMKGYLHGKEWISLGGCSRNLVAIPSG